MQQRFALVCRRTCFFVVLWQCLGEKVPARTLLFDEPGAFVVAGIPHTNSNNDELDQS